MKSTKHPTSSVVILGKFFGILHFKSTDTCLNKFLSIILCVPVVTIYIYIIYLNAYDIVILNYKVGTKVLKILNSLYVLLASCAVVFKYSYYLINSRRIWNVVEKIYELTSTSSRGICKSCWKFWIVFATISFCIFSLNFKAVSDSGLPLPVAWIIFHSLYQQHVSAELYVIGTFLKELRKAYTDVNNNLLSLRYNRTGKRENFNLRKWRILSEYHSLRQEINSLCKASNVVFIPGLAANILIELYFMVGACHICFLHFLIGYQNKDYNLVLMSWMAVSVLFKTGYIMLFINMWMDINNEAQKTVTYMHDIWNDLATEDEINCNAKHLQLVALQLYNSKLSFTAYGFFALDWTLLHRIISAVATYVIILIQFEISSMNKYNSNLYNVTTQSYLDGNYF